MKPLLVIATRNVHKTDEIRAMLQDTWEVRDLSSYEAPEVDETGTTFLENATLKALSASRCIPGIVLADDSGIEVDALEGKPGVLSSSFGGEEGNHAKNNEHMIAELKRVGVSTLDQARARFRCTMVLARDGQIVGTFTGDVEGHMLTELQGRQGFGYDPLFVPDGYDCSFAELSQEEKNLISHRGRALAQVVAFLKV